MSEEIKNIAITAAGYGYQNRQGLKRLCDWLNATKRYTRVKFECDDEAVAPTGLDDIVAERPNDLIDLQQVKYTPNPAKHTLFRKTPRLQKGRFIWSKSALFCKQCRLPPVGRFYGSPRI